MAQQSKPAEWCSIRVDSTESAIETILRCEYAWQHERGVLIYRRQNDDGSVSYYLSPEAAESAYFRGKLGSLQLVGVDTPIERELLREGFSNTARVH
jgi:hypothetical protein